MIEQPKHAYEGRGQTVVCVHCRRRFQVVGPKKPKAPPECPHCGHAEPEDAA